MRRLLAVLLLLVLMPWSAWSATAILDRLTTPLVFRDAGQTNPSTTVTLTLRNLPLGTGRVSNQVDRGSVYTPYYAYVCSFDYTGSYTLGQITELWAAPATADGVASQLGTVDAAIVSGQSERRNSLWPIGTCAVNHTSSPGPNVCAGQAYLPFQLWSLVVWNGTTLPTDDTDAGSWCTFTPYFPEVQ